jgi:ribosomal protein S17E
MEKTLLIILMLFFLGLKASAQHTDTQKTTDSIVNEGKALYRSEWASWYGTDIFLDKCKEKRDRIGGYISYETNDGLNNVFFSKGDDPDVLATTTFGNDFNETNYKLDTIPRKLNATEKELIDIRQKVVKRMSTDTIFKYFNNTSLNPVPLIRNGIKRVYLLTGPKANGVVIFGNDYLVSFGRDNQISNIKRLHKNIIHLQYDKTQTSAMHSHLPETGEFITATDICTLMLYEKFTTWGQYYVLSKNYVSIWDCKKNDLFVMTMEAWKKVGEDHTARHPKQ